MALLFEIDTWALAGLLLTVVLVPVPERSLPVRRRPLLIGTPSGANWESPSIVEEELRLEDIPWKILEN